MKKIIGLCLMSLIIAGCSAAAADAPVPIAQPTQETAPTATLEPTSEPLDETLLATGRESYLRNYCGSCHASTAANTRGTFGPAHEDMQNMASQRIILDSYTGSATTAEEYLRESLLDPRIYYTSGYEATNHHMPAFTHLPEEEIDALVYFLMYQD